ncbi:sensor histidine kinase [Nocardiopsis sp. FIRDI 009]|uniref:sensor histidine kinase n=1 Tax=Nocardiopsis sp. FIRDI 009 TaxID=714197 RepID=UPI000E262741|nr:histidine kinase [Nocardiopsis sp. FIRDI 009]
MDTLLRSVWNEPRPFDPPPRTWRDWALVGALVLVAVLEGAVRPDLPWRFLWTAVVAGLASTLLWRRTRPLAALALASGVPGPLLLVTDGEFAPMYTTVCFLLLPYSLVRWGSGREIVAGAAVVLVGSAVRIALDGSASGLADLVGGFAVLFSVGALAAAVRFRSGARVRELDRVRMLERERLARDLHDTVAHHVSAMAIRAQAGLAVAESRPGAAAEALRVIDAEASRALAEMRAVVRALRWGEPADLGPGPRIGDLRRLAGREGAGPAVDVGITGAVDDLPPPVAAAIFRMAREAVTNARRHARRATRIEVRVTADATSVLLRVSDDGETGFPRPTAAPGYGIVGMTERAALLGGACEAAPGPDRGWTVTAVLPRTGTAA